MTKLEKILAGVIGVIVVAAVIEQGNVNSLFQSPLRLGIGDRLAVTDKGGEGITYEEQKRLAPTLPDVNQIVSPSTSLPPSNQQNAPLEQTSRLVIRSGDLNLVVEDIWVAGKQVIEYAEAIGGYVVSSSITETEKLPSGSVVIRVPEDKFDAVMDFIKKLGTKVEHEGRTGEDVTEEYIDLDAKLKALQAKKDQFYEVLKKAATIDDILKVYDKIEEVQAQINQTEGRMKYLSESAKLAKITVNLALSEDLLPIPESEKWRPGYVAKMAWQETVRFWRNVSYGLIEFFVKHLLTWLAVILILVLILRKPIRRIFQKLGEKKKETKETGAVTEGPSPGSAVASLICGVLGLFFIFDSSKIQWGLILGIAALALGSKEKQNGYGKAGFILGLIIVGLAVLSMLTRGGPIYY